MCVFLIFSWIPCNFISDATAIPPPEVSLCQHEGLPGLDNWWEILENKSQMNQLKSLLHW